MNATEAKATAGESAAKGVRRFPPWIRKRAGAGDEGARVRALLADLRLATVCSSAHCPNLCECYGRGTATFLLLGSTCTRGCRFCAIRRADPGPPREDEPEAVAEAAERLGLKHVVVTSVTRDDLADGGAGHFARTIRAVRARLPQAAVEVLTPDFQGSEEAIETVLDAGPNVFNHNVETVPRLYPVVRPEADYERSLGVLRYAARRAATKDLKTWTKSGLMVGLGETDEEIRAVLWDLRGAGCEIVTIGQYLAPSASHARVERFVEPERFAEWEREARAMGFCAAAAGPFVRSSYRAEHVLPGPSAPARERSRVG